MNYPRIALAGTGAFLAYMVLGGLIFGVLPSLKSEFLKYPAVYRSQQGQMSHMPSGMVAMLFAMLALSVMYAMLYRGGSGIAVGALFGVLIGIFSVGSFVLHNYVNLNIGLRLTVVSAVVYFVEWTVVGIVIGAIYRAR